MGCGCNSQSQIAPQYDFELGLGRDRSYSTSAHDLYPPLGLPPYYGTPYNHEGGGYGSVFPRIGRGAHYTTNAHDRIPPQGFPPYFGQPPHPGAKFTPSAMGANDWYHYFPQSYGTSSIIPGISNTYLAIGALLAVGAYLYFGKK